MQAIRVEHPETGWGMYRNIGFNIFEEDKYYDLVVRHFRIPTPNRDGLGRYLYPDEFCAFKSIEQIQQWIKPEEFNMLIEDGFEVYILELSDALELENQIIFEKQNITEQKNISNLFKSK